MKNLARLRRTIALATDLRSIVETMKTLAAVNHRHFEAAATAIDEYVGTIELGFQVVLREVSPEPPESIRCVGWIVLGSDQGLCGGFNERTTALALEGITAMPGPTLVVGHRVSRRLVDHGIDIEHEFRTPGSTTGLTELVDELLVVLGGWRDEGRIDALRVVHNEPKVGGGFATRVRQLLPLDPTWIAEMTARPWDARRAPTHPHDGAELFRWLVREWLFARVYLACASSVAAENAARLAATQAAQRSLDTRLATLNLAYRRERQEAITEEVLDLYR